MSAPDPNTSTEILELSKQISELELRIARICGGLEINNYFVGSRCRARDIGSQQQTVTLFVKIINVFVRAPENVPHLLTSPISCRPNSRSENQGTRLQWRLVVM
ncbi:hypothetical protein TNCT_151961 [Trichonephila clavata]|uniref:Uncharacterized protein n=1 Tax=Trichonephila clavata TaxID=2740835 RepID=A0A8X6J8Y1_TRICU|nr:hypothetical protein TNCT_151961 [Trichonephila clavata]